MSRSSSASSNDSAPRFRQANRAGLFRGYPLDATLPPDHRARLFVRLADRLDLSGFYASIKAREGHAGRPPADPRVLVTLWLYAFDQGVRSARELDRLCKAHDAYRWILGGIGTNYHQLSDFLVQHEQALLALYEDVLRQMSKQGLLSTRRQAQDGTRVRASAGAASFRREKSLRRLLRRAQRRQAALKRRPRRDRRRQQARRRAWREREERVRAALRALPEVAKAKKDKQQEPRVSTTDPEARVMKQADGGFRPAYNLQFASTTKERVILAVRTTREGSDMAQMEPMLEALRRAGRQPREYLADGGFAKLAAIEKAEARGTRVYAPEQRQRKGKAHEPKPDDPPEVARWRRRMATAKAKRIYQERASTAELVVADLKSHGLTARVRGQSKVHQLGLWASLAHNVRCWLSLLRQRFSGSTLQFLHSL